jgi:hypothetical protein
VANQASAGRELSAGNDRAANAQRVEAEVNRVHAVETGQDRMVIGASAVGNAPARMENAVNVAANPASAAAHSIVRSLSSALTRTATAS